MPKRSATQLTSGGQESPTQHLTIDIASLALIVSDLSDLIDGSDKAIRKCEIYVNLLMQQAGGSEMQPKGTDAFSRLVPLVEALVGLLDAAKQEHTDIFVKCERFLLHALDRAEKLGAATKVTPEKPKASTRNVILAIVGFLITLALIFAALLLL